MDILSVQSHVCFGYVGNRAACFPLQRLGYNVHAVNTVQFSNHSGYGALKGEIFTPQHLEDLFLGLEPHGVFKNTTAMLSGYLGSVELGRVVLNAAKKLKSESPNSLYLCDPVMGDVGRGIFVKPEIPNFFINEMIPAADIITPNHFELETIVGTKISSLLELKKAFAHVHELGPKIVIVTSFLEPEAQKNGSTLKVVMSVSNQDHFYVQSHLFPFKIAPNGTGDLFSALFIGHFLKNKNQPEVALQMATGAIYKVLENNFNLGTRELEIIHSQNSFQEPERFEIHAF